MNLYAKSVWIFTSSAKTSDFTLKVRDSELLEVLRESRRVPGWDGQGRRGD
ncbi:MAG: hypothetical protein HY075_08025 [Deltaproteobacteria bacterium]|nr:hypothetical protein [Deltaproteobacteria bacterium]